MANDSYKARSTGPKGLSKKGKEIERSHYPVLLQAQKAWEEIDPFRHKRKRNRDYTYGKQWNDRIKLPDGRVMTEEEYIRQQGKVPLKNNLIQPDGQDRAGAVPQQPDPARVRGPRPGGTELWAS